MNAQHNATAKLAGIRLALTKIADENVSRVPGGPNRLLRSNFRPGDVAHYFFQAQAQLAVLKFERPDLYGDFQDLRVNPELKMSPTPGSGADDYHYDRPQLERLVRDIDQLFEIQAASTPALTQALKPRRVFITHGRAADWRELQAFIERDVALDTMELAQEVSAGATIIEKLEAGSTRCDSAVIVMTGDDTDAVGQPRSRENVMHEIGYFQGAFGRSNVILLHEDNCSVPSNLAGIVYVAFPKGLISAGFHVVQRELKHVYR